jgi:transposase
MARYRQSDTEYGQNLFIQINLAEQLLPETFEWTLNEAVNELDLREFDADHQNDREGRPAVNPRSLFKLVLYGYSRGILSSRKLENLAQNNIIAKALTHDECPDHSTIAEFVSGSSEKIAGIFGQILNLCNELKLIQGSMFAIDGCRLPSNASKEWSGTHERLREKQEKYEKYAKELLREHGENDRMSKKERERLEKGAEKKQKAAERIRKFLAANEPRIGVSGGEIQSNVTDNESAKIKGPHGVIQGYTGIAAADGKKQVIVVAEAYGTDYEGGEFAPMLDNVRETMEDLTGEEKPLEKALVLLDSNYFSEDNLQAAKDRGIEVLIPDVDFRSRDERFDGRPHHKEKEKDEKKFEFDDFKYDEGDNSYTCPEGKKLICRGMTGLSHHRKARRYAVKEGECLGCPSIERCMKRRGGKKPHRTLYLTEDNEEWLSEQMRKKIDMPENKRVYSHRMEIIEPCFGNIEYCKGMNRFTLRGKKKVDGQWKLYCMVHNIGKCVGRYRKRMAS